MSQLVNRLERARAAASDPIEVAELDARIAGNLARMGRFDEAERRIALIRENFGAGQSGRVTVWVMLAEGLLHFYRNLTPAALDRIARAQHLGRAMKYDSFVGVASAWKAHIEFEVSNYEAMVESLQAALSHSTATDFDARARVGMVLANAFTLCGEKALAQRWFLRGHDNASRNGDRASVEALLYNRAAFGFTRLRAESCVRVLEPNELRVIRSEVQSTKNLQNLTGISALDHHILLVEAGLLLLEQDFALALRAFALVRSRAPFAKYNFHQTLIDLEVAFCEFRLGGSAPDIDRIALSDLEELDIDERMFAAWLLLQMFVNNTSFELQFEALRSAYEESCNRLRERLVAFADS